MFCIAEALKPDPDIKSINEVLAAHGKDYAPSMYNEMCEVITVHNTSKTIQELRESSLT